MKNIKDFDKFVNEELREGDLGNMRDVTSSRPNVMSARQKPSHFQRVLRKYGLDEIKQIVFDHSAFTKKEVEQMDQSELGDAWSDMDIEQSLDEMEEQELNEGGETTGVVGSGTAVSGGSFPGVTVAGVSVDGGSTTQGSSGGGVSVSTLANTSGMGPVKSAQPSNIPGDVAGSTKGSGDIGSSPLKAATKSFPNKNKRKRKKKKSIAAKGAHIDNFYTSKYTEKVKENGHVIQNWTTYNEEMINNED